MVPPEDILDRFVKTVLQHETGCSTYRGTLDVEQIESPSFRDFLFLIKRTMNEALRLENDNVSGGVEHSPFHFDYVDADIPNAHAFQHEGSAFIVVTLPFVELILDVSRALSRSSVVLELLRLDPKTAEVEALHGWFFQMQLSFLVSHEYTHHIHQHDGVSWNASLGVWTEFPDGIGNIHSQTQELDADGYATFITLAHLLRGERRQSALAQWRRQDIQDAEGDELLLAAYFLSVIALFCEFWRGESDITSVYESTHPLPPVRITFLIRVGQMWCDQNASLSPSWFTRERFNAFFRAASEAIPETDRKTWDAQLAFFRSADGAAYDQQLRERLDKLRRGE
jgi:hypothetical protein